MKPKLKQSTSRGRWNRCNLKLDGGCCGGCGGHDNGERNKGTQEATNSQGGDGNVGEGGIPENALRGSCRDAGCGRHQRR